MVGGRLRCLSCYRFTLSLGLLLGVCLHNAEVSGGKHVINKKVGDSVEFSPNVPTEGFTDVQWIYKNVAVAVAVPVANKQLGVNTNNPFQDRLEFNNINFSLTIRKLTLQDSGDFQFHSEVNYQQKPSVTFTLQVHEVIKKPTLTSKIIHHPANRSCTVSVECSEPSAIDVSYSLTVGNQTHRVHHLQHIIRPEDGATTITCTASNDVSETSASKTVTCSNKPIYKEKLFVWILAAAGGSLLLLIIIITVSVCLCKQRRGGSDSNELTVYADISDFAVEAGPSANSKPCSLYDMIENTTQTAVPQATMQPQTVYDKIQFDRMRKASVSPYQEVS